MNTMMRRAIAYAIDVLIIGIPLWIIDMVFGIIGWVLSWIPILGWFSGFFTGGWIGVLVYTLYETLMVYLTGQTLGKMVMDIRVNTHSGSRGISASACLVRGFVKAVSANIIVLAVVSLFYMNRYPHSSIHDQLAQTEVW